MKKLFVSIAALVLSIFVFGAALFAWFSSASPFYNIKFNLNNVNVDVGVYEGSDFNYDGFVDLDADGQEIYTAVTGDAWLGVMAPSKVFTYKVTAAGDRSSMSVSVGNVAAVALQKYLTYRAGTSSAEMAAADFKTANAETFTVIQNVSVTDSGGSVFFQLCLAPYDAATAGVTEAEYQALQSKTSALQLVITAQATA